MSEIRWFCRAHPFNWWHEVGCPHREWTKAELLDALLARKRAEVRQSIDINSNPLTETVN